MADITSKDILAWLDMQRDAVNTEIVYAAQTEKKQYHKYLEIINALAERVNEMTAVEFLDSVNKECSKHEGVADGVHHPCDGCPFHSACIYGDDIPPRHAVEIVKRWKGEQL